MWSRSMAKEFSRAGVERSRERRSRDLTGGRETTMMETYQHIRMRE